MTHKNIVQALVAASKGLQGVAKDGTAGKMYDFVSHEAMVAVARGPLLENGLVLTCTDITEVESFFEKGQHYYQGNFKWKLSHADSEQVDFQWAPGMGQDRGDKAAAKAMTYSHKQALRFLLNIPIKDKGFEADLDYQPKPEPKPKLDLSSLPNEPPKKRYFNSRTGENLSEKDHRALKAAETKTRTRSFDDFKAESAGTTKVKKAVPGVGGERLAAWREKAESWGFTPNERKMFVTNFFKPVEGKKFGWENIDERYWKDFEEMDAEGARQTLNLMRQTGLAGIGGM